MHIITMITLCSLLCLSCGVITSCGVNIQQVCTKGTVNLNEFHWEMGRVPEKRSNERQAQEVIQSNAKNNPSHLYRSASIFTVTVER